MPFFSIYSFISYCLLCIHLWLPQLVKTESVKLYFRSRMQAVSEGCFVLLLFWFGLVLGLFFFFFFSEHLLFLSVWVCLVLLCAAFPSAVSRALMDSSILQARHFRRRPREAKMLWYFSCPCPDLPYPCFIWHRSLDCGKLAANSWEKFWGCPKLVQYKEVF